MDTYFTYEDLAKEIQIKNRLEENELKKLEEALKVYAEFFNKNFKSIIGNEFILEKNRDSIFEASDIKYTQQYIEDINLQIDFAAKEYLYLSYYYQFKDNTFAETLKWLRESNPEIGTANTIARKIKIPVSNYYRWEKGEQIPQLKNIKKVEELERFYGIPKGVLVEKLGHIHHGKKGSVLKQKEHTNYGALIARLKEFPYSLKRSRWPDSLKKEMFQLRDFHIMNPETLKDKNLEREAENIWGIKNGQCSTFNNALDNLEKFFGYCTAPQNHQSLYQKGLGLPVSELSLALLTNFQIVTEFLYFLAQRQNTAMKELILKGYSFPLMLAGDNTEIPNDLTLLNAGLELCDMETQDEIEHSLKSTEVENTIYSKGILNFIKMILPLVREKGYLFQSSETYAARFLELNSNGEIIHPLKKSSTAEEDSSWRKQCQKVLSELEDLKSQTHFHSLRDTSELIASFLDDKEALNLIKATLDAMKKDSTRHGLSDRDRATQYRDYILAKSHFIFGLRSEHYAYWDLEKQICIKDDTVMLVLYNNDFKTSRSLSFTKVTLNLPKDFSREILLYINEYRPLLNNTDSKSFFLPSKNSNYKNKKFKHLLPSSVSRTFSESMALYSPLQKGFRSQAVRKILNLSLDGRNNQENFSIASALLVHSPEVNQKHYTYAESNIKIAFNYHLDQLRMAGILEGLSDEELKIQITQKEYNDLLKTITRLKNECRNKNQETHIA